MIFHTFGEKTDKTVIFIHGMLTPWQIWNDAIVHFSRQYHIIVPELDAHTEETVSSFETVEKEAESIREYVMENFGGKVFMVCGLSMGGRIAATFAGLPDIHTDNLVLDGAPLIRMPQIVVSMIKKNYISLIRRSQKRDPKVMESFKKSFLPEKYLDNYLKIADNMEEVSIGNIMDSVFTGFEFKKYDETCRILCMHGTKGNEAVSKKGAVRMKEVNPQTTINCYEGYAHAQLACFESEKWIEEVEKWLRI
ncbi:MAG: alpha/beta hydrolase [Lachnospiraceae bacterium]|nr:alpha/beta hydrolase [Lachnospiraceae bacterium]